jgi:hypothetical protein
MRWVVVETLATMTGRVQGGETEQSANLCRGDQVAGKDRELVRAAHGNHSARQGQQADRVWQAGQNPGIVRSNHQSFRSLCRTAWRAVVGSGSVLIAGNVIQIGRCLARQGKSIPPRLFRLSRAGQKWTPEELTSGRTRPEFRSRGCCCWRFRSTACGCCARYWRR